MKFDPKKLPFWVNLVSILINALGATLTFVYFRFIEFGLQTDKFTDALANSPSFFFMVVGLLSALISVTVVKFFRPIWRELSSAPDEMEPDRLSRLVGRLINLPFAVALLSLIGWLGAGIIYGFFPEIHRTVLSQNWRPELRLFFGIVFVGAPFTVLTIFFVLEWMLRNWIRQLFPSRLLTSLPHSVKTNVLRKMIFVSVFVGSTPVSVVSYVTLSQIHEVGAGNQTISSFISHMPVVIGFLLILAVVVSIGLSIFMARSVSEPLQQTRAAMESIRNGDLEACVPVLSNDEIGFIAEGFNRMVQGLRERDFIRQTFGSYLSPDVVTEILKSPEGINLGGELREVTILVSDLRGFTSLSASLPPHVVVGALNLYLEKMVNIILNHGGTVDEFTGDGILAFFGAPTHLADSQIRAVQCAVRMQREMAAVNTELSNATRATYPLNDGFGAQTSLEESLERFLPLKMGIAINCGTLILGNIGCEKRKKYGAVGTPINIAFRVEKVTGGGEIIITQEVYRRVEEVFETVPVPKVKLKGINDLITLYKVEI